MVIIGGSIHSKAYYEPKTHLNDINIFQLSLFSVILEEGIFIPFYDEKTGVWTVLIIWGHIPCK